MMISNRRLSYIMAISILSFLVFSCVYDELDSSPSDLQVNLRWVKSFPGEQREDIMTGLKWTLSFLGATLPQGSFERAISWDTESRFQLNLAEVGFNDKAQKAWLQILLTLKDSEEYKKFNALDLGRFVVVTLNSSHHYYAITGANDKLQELQNKYAFHPKAFAVTSSSIAYGHRVIQLPEAESWEEVAFIATEGEGEVNADTFVPQEYEALILMPNGQLRFALYDLNGNLKVSASPELTPAGKPAKCLWCHEISLQVLHTPNQPVAGYLTPEEFTVRIIELNAVIKNYRATLESDINFNKTQEHTQTELIYIGFMEPSAYRLAQEWNKSVNEVEAQLQSLSTHEHHEFSFFGDHLYLRKDVDLLAPYETMRVPDDAREYSQYEPDFL